MQMERNIKRLVRKGYNSYLVRAMRATDLMEHDLLKDKDGWTRRNAIEALLGGRPVPVEKTRVFGCSTKWSEKRGSAAEALKRWNAEPVSLETIDEDGVRKLAKNDTKKLRLINVWATWCGPYS